MCIRDRGFYIFQIFNLLDKGDNVSAGTASKTVEGLTIWINREGWGLFTVKRTEAHQISAPAFQVHIGGDHLLNITVVLELLYK